MVSPKMQEDGLWTKIKKSNSVCSASQALIKFSKTFFSGTSKHFPKNATDTID